jgi:glycosyltransferase involved in cell wall biosynthesis
LDEGPFISVIIPAWNNPALIAKCLAAMGDQTYPRDRYEVLVVDNASTDDTAEVARSFSFATVLSEPTPGSYSARNRGLAAARGDYVAFTDADCIPDRAWLAAAARAAREHPEAAILAGQIEMFRADSADNGVCEKYESAFDFDQAAHARHGLCMTANWVSPRQALIDLGGFHQDLKSGGDWDLSRRVQASGQPIVYVPEMRVSHPTRGSLPKLMAKLRRTMGGKWQFNRSRWRFLSCCAALVRLSAKRIRMAASDRRFSLGDRLMLIGIVVTLLVTGIFELTRLAFGAEPRRA